MAGSLLSLYRRIPGWKKLKEWGANSGTFRPYQSQSDVFLALAQGQIDATIAGVEVAESNVKSGKFPGISIVGKADIPVDYVSLFANRQEYGLINYLNLFINQQVRSGRYAELYSKWVGTAPPDLTIHGVYR